MDKKIIFRYKTLHLSRGMQFVQNFDQTSLIRRWKKLHARIVILMRYNREKETERMDIELTGEALEWHNEIAKQTIHFYLKEHLIRKALIWMHFLS